MEKRIDMHIDLLRREEFREMECVNDVAKCVFSSVPILVTADPQIYRIHAQFDHIGETYFAGFDFDLGERELGYALSFDHDLDMFAASLGLVKTSIEAVVKEDGRFLLQLQRILVLTLVLLLQDVVLDMGDFDPAEALYTPLKRVLDQCRSGKNPSRYVPSYVGIQNLTWL